MPATVVTFSCHIFRFSISLKYSASTEKSPQPGHQVGWSAASSFFVNPLRSEAGNAGALGGFTATLPFRGEISVTGELMFSKALICCYTEIVFLMLAQSRCHISLRSAAAILHLP